MALCLVFNLFFVLITRCLPFYVDSITLPIDLYQQQLGFNNRTSTVYLFGGASSGYLAYSNSIYKRNINNASMLWQQISSNTTPIFVSWVQSSATVDDVVYFLGVNNGSVQSINKVSTFNLTSEQFIDLHIPPYKHPAHSGCVTSNGSHIFMVGGIIDSSDAATYSDYIQILNIELKIWNYTKINIKFWGQSCAMVNNIIYVFSGNIINGSIISAINTVYKYNTLSTEWLFVGNISNINTANSGSAVYSAIDDNIYVHGYNMMVFNVKKEIIIYEEPLSVPVQICPMMIYNNTLMIFGGYYAWVSVAVTGYQCTSLIQMVKLPLTDSGNISCTQRKVINTTWIVIILLLFVISIIICNSLSIYYYKKRYVDVFANNAVNDEVINNNENRLLQDDGNNDEYHSIDSQSPRIRVM